MSSLSDDFAGKLRSGRPGPEQMRQALNQRVTGHHVNTGARIDLAAPLGGVDYFRGWWEVDRRR